MKITFTAYAVLLFSCAENPDEVFCCVDIYFNEFDFTHDIHSPETALLNLKTLPISNRYKSGQMLFVGCQDDTAQLPSAAVAIPKPAEPARTAAACAAKMTSPSNEFEEAVGSPFNLASAQSCEARFIELV